MSWKPTNEFRWYRVRKGDGLTGGWVEPVLQQKWVNIAHNEPIGDGYRVSGVVAESWRDVPVEFE